MLGAIHHLWGLHELSWLVRPRLAWTRAAVVAMACCGLWRWALAASGPGYVLTVIAALAVPVALAYAVLIATAVAQWEHAQQVFRAPRRR